MFDQSLLESIGGMLRPVGVGNSPEEAVAASLYGLEEGDLLKALATDGTIGTDGSSLIGESLDPVVKSITLDPRNMAPKHKRFFTFDAKSVIEQFTRRSSLGLAQGALRSQGGLGPQDAGQYTRVTANMKYYGQVGSVTRTMNRVGAEKFGDIKAMEMEARLSNVLLFADRDLWWANTSLNSMYFSGLFQQAPTDSTRAINLATTGTAGSRTTYTAGGSLTLASVRSRTDIPLQYNKFHTALYCSPKEKISLGSEQDTNGRFYLRDVESNYALGLVTDKIANDFNQAGIDIVWDIWLNFERGRLSDTPPNPSGTFHAQVPDILAVAPTGAAAATGYLVNDVYYYGVSAVNEFGEGPIKLQSSGYTADNTNGTVNVTVTHNSYTGNIKSYRLYRSTTNGTDYTKMRLVKEVAINTGAATQVIADDGSFIPGSRRAALVAETDISLGKLLAPTSRDLADIDNTHRFTVDYEFGVLLYDGGNAMVTYSGIGGSVADPA